MLFCPKPGHRISIWSFEHYWLSFFFERVVHVRNAASWKVSRTSQKGFQKESWKVFRRVRNIVSQKISRRYQKGFRRLAWKVVVHFLILKLLGSSSRSSSFIDIIVVDLQRSYYLLGWPFEANQRGAELFTSFSCFCVPQEEINKTYKNCEKHRVLEGIRKVPEWCPEGKLDGFPQGAKHCIPEGIRKGFRKLGRKVLFNFPYLLVVV